MKTLLYKSGISKGTNTYGYNLITLKDAETGQRFRQCGGGYDMLGAALADALVTLYPDNFNAIHASAAHVINKQISPYILGNPKGLYGFYAYYDNEGVFIRTSLDGATGFSNVESVARAAGLSIKCIYDKKSSTLLYIIIDDILINQ